MARVLIETIVPAASGAAPADTAAPQVLNQAPAPAATGIPTNTTIGLDIVDVGSGVNLGSIIIDVTIGAGTPEAAYSGSAFQGTWTGSVTAIANGYRFSITPAVALPELTAISVRVRATDLSALLNAADVTYSFTTADETAPSVVNLSPVNGATGVSESTNVSFRVTDGGSGVDSSTLDVTLTEGVLGSPAAAITGGVFQAPYNGAGSSITPGAGFIDVVIDRVGDLPMNDTTSITVSVDDLAGNTGGRTWSFSTAPPAPPPPPPAILNVPATIRAAIDMYPFLVLPIREADRLEGQLFLRRLIDGFNDVWAVMIGEVERLATLFDPLAIPAELLRYQLALLGWSTEERFDAILEVLDELTLRRLMRTSGRLWNERASEDLIRDAIRGVHGVRVRIWNWFDFRWLCAQTGLSELHRTNDPWVIDLPRDFGGNAADENRSNIRLVDPGSLNRVLLRRLLNLLRPAGERYRITYLLFLDDFLVDGDDAQWLRTSSSAYTVAGGTLQLDDVAAEDVRTIVTGAATWSDYLVATKIRGTAAATGQRIGVTFYQSTATTYYAVMVDFFTQVVELVRVDAGVPTSLGTVVLGSLSLRFTQGNYFTFRIEAFAVTGGATQIRVRFDGFTLFDLSNPSGLTEGAIGYLHDAGATIEVDDVEVMPIPGDFEDLEINANP